MDLQGPVSVDEEVAALSRSADRDRLFMQAALTLSGRADPLIVRVRNLSAGGLLAETPHTQATVASGAAAIGRAHVCTPVPNSHLVCRLMLEKKKIIKMKH